MAMRRKKKGREDPKGMISKIVSKFQKMLNQKNDEEVEESQSEVVQVSNPNKG
jgi:hypothetical protein